MYNVIEISRTQSATARAMTPKATFDDALMVLHQAMASAIANGNVLSIVCEIMDDDGNIRKRDDWERQT